MINHSYLYAPEPDGSKPMKLLHFCTHSTKLLLPFTDSSGYTDLYFYLKNQQSSSILATNGNSFGQLTGYVIPNQLLDTDKTFILPPKTVQKLSTKLNRKWTSTGEIIVEEIVKHDQMYRPAKSIICNAYSGIDQPAITALKMNMPTEYKFWKVPPIDRVLEGINGKDWTGFSLKKSQLKEMYQLIRGATYLNKANTDYGWQDTFCIVLADGHLSIRAGTTALSQGTFGVYEIGRFEVNKHPELDYCTHAGVQVSTKNLLNIFKAMNLLQDKDEYDVSFKPDVIRPLIFQSQRCGLNRQATFGIMPVKSWIDG